MCDQCAFWLSGLRVGIDTDSSVNVCLKGSKFFFDAEPGAEACKIGGVGGEASLSVQGTWILPFRHADGAVSLVVPDTAYESGHTDINIVSAHMLCEMGYKLVMDAPSIIHKWRGKNPHTSPEGHALIAPDGGVIWLKIKHGLLVAELADVNVTTDMVASAGVNIKEITHDSVAKGRPYWCDFMLKHLSAKAVHKARVESCAREYKKDKGCSYDEALKYAEHVYKDAPMVPRVHMQALGQDVTFAAKPTYREHGREGRHSAGRHLDSSQIEPESGQGVKRSLDGKSNTVDAEYFHEALLDTPIVQTVPKKKNRQCC